MYYINGDRKSRIFLLASHCLLFLYIIFFFMYKNSEEYSPLIYETTLTIAIIYCSILFTVGIFSNHRWLLIIYNLLYYLGFACVLHATYLTGFWIENIPYYFIISWAVLCISILLFEINIIKPVLQILVILCIFSCSLYIKSIYFKISPNFPTDNLGEMSSKPNIYLIVLESYQGNEALKTLYNYNNSDFENWLAQKGFTIYPNSYSAWSHTRSSVTNILSISNLDEKIPLKDLLLQNIPSPVLDTLLKNDYTLYFRFATPYLTEGDFSEWVIDNTWKYRKNMTFDFQKSLFFSRNAFDLKNKYNTHADYVKYLSSEIANISNTPHFFMTKIGGISSNYKAYEDGLTHTDVWYTGEAHLIPLLRKKYISELKKQNILLKDILTDIQKKDPNAIIILVGDHGGLFFKVLKDDKKYKDFNISTQEYILDQFNILMAIHWPKNLTNNNEKINYTFEIFDLIYKKLIPTYSPRKNEFISRHSDCCSSREETIFYPFRYINKEKK